jgi:8-amino-7-oxononanoate synthase
MLPSELSSELAELSAERLLRKLRLVERGEGMKASAEGRECVLFCSNDYLGLARDPRIVRASQEAIGRYGAGSGASRLICGDLPIHRQLEAAVAEFKHCEAAACFPSGFQANLGVITALLGKEDAVVCDRLNHASILDACRLSGAKLLVYKHADSGDLGRCLSRRDDYRRCLIVTDGIFSMDGDSAPLVDICRLAEEHQAMVMVDEAHATGVRGDQGQGLVHELGLAKQVDIQMGTLSKALGSQGGYIAGSKELVECLHNRARSFIYTTALSPASSGAAKRAIELLTGEEAGLTELLANLGRLKEGLRGKGLAVDGSVSAIVPLVVGGEREALELSERLLEKGYLVPAVRPPTVPKGTSRLRITVSAVHQASQIDGLVSAIGELI